MKGRGSTLPYLGDFLYQPFVINHLLIGVILQSRNLRDSRGPHFQGQTVSFREGIGSKLPTVSL